MPSRRERGSSSLAAACLADCLVRNFRTRQSHSTGALWLSLAAACLADCMVDTSGPGSPIRLARCGWGKPALHSGQGAALLTWGPRPPPLLLTREHRQPSGQIRGQILHVWYFFSVYFPFQRKLELTAVGSAWKMCWGNGKEPSAMLPKSPSAMLLCSPRQRGGGQNLGKPRKNQVYVNFVTLLASLRLVQQTDQN